MTLRPLIAAIDTVLQPLGFRRRKAIWNRRVESFVDVVTLQRSKAGDSATVNIGVLSPTVFELCWGEPPKALVEEVHCIVRSRLGQLHNGKELWWAIGDEQSAAEISKHLTSHAVPFLTRMHSYQAMRQFLVDARVPDRQYPPEVIYLAILQAELGDRSGACALLQRVGATTSSAWKSRVSEVESRLSC